MQVQNKITHGIVGFFHGKVNSHKLMWEFLFNMFLEGGYSLSLLISEVFQIDQELNILKED